MVIYEDLSTSKYDGRYYVLYLYDIEQSITNNTSTFSWMLEARGGNSSWYAERDLKVVIGGKTVFSKTDRVERYEGTIKEGTITIIHNTDGTKTITASIEAAVYGSSINVKGSKSITIDRIARNATITFAPNFFDTDSPTINYSNPMGSAAEALEACISLTGATDNVKYRAISKTGNTYTFNLTEAERNVLRNASPNSNNLTVRFYVRTTIGGVKYMNYSAATMTIVDANPTFTLTAIDTNSATIALTGDKNKLIRYHSNLKYTIAATALKGASISKYSIKCGNNTLTTNTGTFEKPETSLLEVMITDSRGNITKQNVYTNMVQYVPITCNIENSNISVDGSVSIKLNGLYYSGSFGATSNNLTLYYRIYEDGKIEKPAFKTAEYSTFTNTYSQPAFKAQVGETGLDYRLNYVIEAYATDKLIERVDAIPYIVSSYPIFDWSDTDFNFNVPVSINGVSLLDIFYPIGSIYYTADNNINPKNIMGGRWISSLNLSSDGYKYWQRVE